MKKIVFLLLALLALPAVAQRYTVAGTVLEGETGETAYSASVALLGGRDSISVAGAAVKEDGTFQLGVQTKGNYVLRISYMGYKTYYRDIAFAKDNKKVDLGTIRLEEDTRLLKEAEVTVRAAQVEMKADTFVYNSSAYRLPEGSALEELVRKLPGAEVSDDGTIKINGKEVKKIMVGGKEFFNNDTKMAMKNIPTNMVEKIKAYDRQSDYSRVTGIDDGEEETVLDLSVKKGMKDGWLVNVDLGYGTEDRYTGKVNLSRFTDHGQFMLLGSRNNVGDRGFPGGGGGFRGGGGGITTSTMGGLNGAWENGKKEDDAGYLEIGGNIRFNQTKTTSETRTNSETFLTNTTSTFGNSWNHSVSHSSNLNIGAKLEWKPDSLTTITFRPQYSHSESKNDGLSQSVTFNDDPYLAGMTDPLAEYRRAMDPDSIRVNGNDRYSYGDSKGNSVDGHLLLNRRLMKPGRNLMLDIDGAWNKRESNSSSRSMIDYFQTSARERKRATYQDNLSPSLNYSYQARLSYSEPLAKNLNLQLSYQIQRRYQDSNRELWTYPDLINALYGVQDSAYVDQLTALDLMTGNVAGVDLTQLTLDMENSQFATYKEWNHSAQALFRYNNKFENGQQLRINLGVSFQPQVTHMDYQKRDIDTTVTRRTQNWAPRFDVRWKISNTSQLRLRYNGRMSQPSMTNLIEVIDDSNPLNISTGNAGLKSSWSDSFNAFYNNYITERQMGWMVNYNVSKTRRSISSATIYDSQTGARYTRPMNIDGNWNMGANLMFNTAMGAKKYWNVMNFARVNYANNVGYISSDLTAEARAEMESRSTGDFMHWMFNEHHVPLRKATTKNTTVGDNLRLNFRNDLLEVGANAGFNYNHARNAMQKNANMDTWQFSYGGNFQLNLPFDLQISTDISEESRRGYNDPTMNTDELIWNAQVAQNFKRWLKGTDLTLSVQWYDILQQRSNISRSISATMRSDTWTNAINSYFMVHIIYKLNLMGQKGNRTGGPGGPDGPRGGRGGRPMGGGFGGPGGGHGHD